MFYYCSPVFPQALQRTGLWLEMSVRVDERGMAVVTEEAITDGVKSVLVSSTLLSATKTYPPKRYSNLSLKRVRLRTLVLE